MTARHWKFDPPEPSSPQAAPAANMFRVLDPTEPRSKCRQVVFRIDKFELPVTIVTSRDGRIDRVRIMDYRTGATLDSVPVGTFVRASFWITGPDRVGSRLVVATDGSVSVERPSVVGEAVGFPSAVWSKP